MTAGPHPLTWVIGAGGLLGRRVADTLTARAPGSVMTTPIRWSTPSAGADLAAGVERLTRAAEPGRAWRVAWCAGAGVTGTATGDLDREVATLTGLLDGLAGRSGRLGPGKVFLASSAGGLYAGTPGGGPFNELHPARPISDYGHAKLAGERAAARFAAETGSQVLIGRIANLYGPGQNMAKAQGLISHLCRSHISRQPISIYVPLDTIRDYLFVDDCAEMVADLLDTAAPLAPDPGLVLVKVLASHQGTSVGSLLATCRQVFKRPLGLVLGRSANARFQISDLRLNSLVWPEIDRRALTPLPVGIAATLAGMLRSAQRAS